MSLQGASARSMACWLRAQQGTHDFYAAHGRLGNGGESWGDLACDVLPWPIAC